MDDRRRFPRWTISNKVIYKKTSDVTEHQCVSRDICCTGACISLSEAIKPDTELDLKLHVGNNAEPVLARGKVMWIAPTLEGKDNPFLAGVRFNYLMESEKEKIFNYAIQFRKEEITSRWWQGV